MSAFQNKWVAAQSAFPIVNPLLLLKVLPVFRGVDSSLKIVASAAIVIGAISIALPSAPAAPMPPSYLVVDSQTGHVLIEQNAREKRQVASLTKIATACVVLDWVEKKGGDVS